ncbi:MAG: hypothetical protein IPK79_05075 [Vampirovibrionales bacterium]|nr:hypothetical protein [Vampirovibrionales bacterium]
MNPGFVSRAMMALAVVATVALGGCQELRESGVIVPKTTLTHAILQDQEVFDQWVRDVEAKKTGATETEVRQEVYAQGDAYVKAHPEDESLYNLRIRKSEEGPSIKEKAKNLIDKVLD